MRNFLARFMFFRLWLNETWADGFDKGESWNLDGGVTMQPPKNPYGLGHGIEEE